MDALGLLAPAQTWDQLTCRSLTYKVDELVVVLAEQQTDTQLCAVTNLLDDSINLLALVLRDKGVSVCWHLVRNGALRLRLSRPYTTTLGLSLLLRLLQSLGSVVANLCPSVGNNQLGDILWRLSRARRS